MKKLAPIWFFFIIISTYLFSSSENQIANQISFEQDLYALDENVSFKEVTSLILAQKNLPESAKEAFIRQGRRFFVFSYPSDGLKVKSMISFIEGNTTQPLIFLLRGASRMESLPAFLYPSKELLFCMESESTVIACSYRDGVSEGEDEYGGDDVNDVYHLTLHLPRIFSELNISIDEKRRYMIGLSRGGLFNASSNENPSIYEYQLLGSRRRRSCT